MPPTLCSCFTFLETIKCKAAVVISTGSVCQVWVTGARILFSVNILPLCSAVEQGVSCCLAEAREPSKGRVCRQREYWGNVEQNNLSCSLECQDFDSGIPLCVCKGIFKWAYGYGSLSLDRRLVSNFVKGSRSGHTRIPVLLKQGIRFLASP